ncbi:hypothetical protein PFICI_07638 [Pestalotiopsis fici W106-1]|uniref:AT hook domain-containing protein n=1 Tax=Pestalotiopsis fici (strain W106-1 / CGMCC3.15140) TaxID=1229662 RepID=W3X261_PESFW|nr:uncharacterized protein PFICI_07638 [Pestalotiopsis fici W106-1]ETS80109.1 hypothetical protein PFICI_07638 [Pestalotiopsis fici W106-1]
MAPSRTRARPTGREQRATAKKDEPITAAESGVAAGGEKPKRGRGRPPKNGVSKVVKVPSGRPRGRPPKDPNAPPKPKPAAATTAATGTGRRGRPRKSDAAATPKKSATPKKAASATKPAGSGRRGRPRKSEPIEEPEDSGAEEIVEGAESPEEDGGESLKPMLRLQSQSLRRDWRRDSSPQRDSSHPLDAGIDTGAEADVEVGDALDGEEVPAAEEEEDDDEDAVAEDDDDAEVMLKSMIRPLAAF